MRHGTSNRRTRGRGNNGNSNGNRGPNKNKVFDSSGPEVRIRGTAHQITEKYMVLAKDASSSGDHILAQSYMQHAEHYQRLVNEWAENQQAVIHKEKKPDVSSENVEKKEAAPVQQDILEDA